MGVFWGLLRQHHIHQYWGHHRHHRQQKFCHRYRGHQWCFLMGFLVLWEFLKYWLRFINEYWYFWGSIEPESFLVALKELVASSPTASGSSLLGASDNFFLGFFGVWEDFEILIAIYQWMWGVGYCQVRGLGGIIICRGGWSFGGRGLVESNFIIYCNFWIFLRGFGGCGGGMKVSISQLIWVAGDCQYRVLCGSLWGNSGKIIRLGG